MKAEELKLSELRVANILAYCCDYCTVATIGKNTIGFYQTVKGGNVEFNREVNSTNFKPVRLTPEVLELVGFSKYQYVYIKSSNTDNDCLRSFCLMDYEDRGHFYFNPAGDNSIHVKYLHQLQNIYCALTNTELTIDLTKMTTI